MADTPGRARPEIRFADGPDGVVEHTPGPWFQKIALSFDGGGVRGYWSLLVLQHLMRVIRDIELEADGATRSSFHPCDEPDNVSQLAGSSKLAYQTDYTPFLPCHYFDYMGGTSTGAFRMTVEDCLSEYELMAGIIFGNPRMIHKMNTMAPRNKYSTKALEKAIKQVIGRRSQIRVGDDTEPLFQTEIDTCRGVVLATRLHDNNLSTTRFLFRSYTPYSERIRTHGQGNGGLRLKNPEEGIRISLLKVALAGTAAPFYFGHYHTVLSTAQANAAKRALTMHETSMSRTATDRTTQDTRKRLPDGKCSYVFEDAGFSTANNPCKELHREIEFHHGDNKTVLVSIGTARPREEFVGEGAATIIRRGLHRLGNPEEVHESLEQDRDRGQCFYYRLNDADGIKIEMDDWKPRRVGSETIAKMKSEFNNWLQRDGVTDTIRECAAHLVRLRRARMITPRWERFALGQYFICQVRNCPKDRDNQWLDREDFENHLRREHLKEDYGEDLHNALDSCQRIWTYRPRSSSS